MNIIRLKKLVREFNELKRMVKKMDLSISYIKLYLKHVDDIAKARKDKRTIPLEKLFRELGY